MKIILPNGLVITEKTQIKSLNGDIHSLLTVDSANSHPGIKDYKLCFSNPGLDGFPPNILSFSSLGEFQNMIEAGIISIVEYSDKPSMDEMTKIPLGNGTHINEKTRIIDRFLNIYRFDHPKPNESNKNGELYFHQINNTTNVIPQRIFFPNSHSLLEALRLEEYRVLGNDYTSEEPKQPEPTLQKPPLGLMPKKFWIGQRITAIHEAIMRYASEQKEIPAEWIEEYNEHVRGMK